MPVHGASWNFIIWGLYFGFIIYLEKKVIFKFTEKIPGLIQWFFAIIIIMVGWGIFYYVDLNKLSMFLKALVGLNKNPLYSQALLITFKENVAFTAVAAFLCTPVMRDLFVKLNSENKLNGKLDYARIALNLCLVFCIISLLVGAGYNPFLYYRF